MPIRYVKSGVVAVSLLLSGTVSVAADPPWLGKIRLPPGFRISVFTDQTPNARSLAAGEDGTVYVGTMQEGKVYAVRDGNRDGKADHVSVIASGLNMPNGVAYLEGSLYVAEIHRIVRFTHIDQNLDRPPQPEVVFDQYPKDVHHGWKYLRIGPDGKFYVPVGAPCNICLSPNEVYATVTRFDPTAQKLEIFAHGVRNTVGFDWHPETRELWFADNGRDWLGDDLPPEELNRAPKPGLHFGYPYCHGGDIPDPKFGKEKPCGQFEPPAWKFPAHVAPLGIRFYTGNQFPPEYRNQLFVAQHGSWNRTEPQGYRVVVVTFADGKPAADRIFADGWLQPDGAVLGRPVDVLQQADGSLLVSDDKQGIIYRITYDKKTPAGR